MIRRLVALLDPEVPAVAGCEIHCDPLAPICRRCRTLLEKDGDAVAITLAQPDDRYGEKLATPDVSIADLIGEIDPIKVAEGRHLADARRRSTGLVPRTKPRHLRDQRAAGPDGEDPGRPLQPDGRARRADQGVPGPSASTCDRRQRQPREDTPAAADHHAAQDRLTSRSARTTRTNVETEIVILDQEVPTTERGGRPVRVPDFVKAIVAQLTRSRRASRAR